MDHCFNPQLAPGRVQSSDWPALLSIRIKRVLNIAFIQVSTSKCHKEMFNIKRYYL